jgi:hypothetical protein
MLTANDCKWCPYENLLLVPNISVNEILTFEGVLRNVTTITTVFEAKEYIAGLASLSSGGPNEAMWRFQNTEMNVISLQSLFKCIQTKRSFIWSSWTESSDNN